MNKSYLTYTTIFLILLLLTIICYTVLFLKNAHNYEKIPLYKNMNVIVEGTSDIDDDLKIKGNDKIENFDRK